MEFDKILYANIISFMKTGHLFEQTTLYKFRELKKQWIRFKIAVWKSLIQKNDTI